MELEEGRAYTNRSGVFGREIIAFEGKDVQYRDSMLSTGEPIASSRVCSRGTFRNFAARLCTDEEVARSRRDETARQDKLICLDDQNWANFFGHPRDCEIHHHDLPTANHSGCTLPSADHPNLRPLAPDAKRDRDRES